MRVSRTVTENTVRAYGCTADCDYYFGPSPLINDDPDLVRIARRAAAEVMGEDAFRTVQKSTGAEDFSVYTESVPGVYGYLGIRNPEKGIECTNHHPGFKVDEDVLVRGAEIYVRFARDYLNEYAPG